MSKIPKIIYQEKYRKGVIYQKWALKDLIDNNYSLLVPEILSKTKYSDGTESITVELKITPKP